MKDGKKKSEQNNKYEEIDDSIRKIINRITPPPFYEIKQFDDKIVKTFPFIRDHSKIYRKNPTPDEKPFSKSYSELSAYKNELESQLEDNYKYCVEQHNRIKSAALNWLFGKTGQLDRPLNAFDEKGKQVRSFTLKIHSILHNVMYGVEVHRIKKWLRDPLRIEIDISSSKTPVVFDIDEFISSIQDWLDKIESVVSRSVDLYLKYLNLCNLDPKEIFESNSYGFHQENEEWVSQKWHEVRKELPSDRQADIRIKKMYSKKFNGKSISHSQIQRFTGRQ